MELTADATVGRFVSDAATYWTPDKRLIPPVTIPADSTAWVLGQDPSGDYYKIIWVCNYLWVPQSTMGPNYDDVWNGAPLPTSVIEPD